ncbi:MAG: hypothetical protein ACJAU2_001187 [Maribacter sp.]|jgi:hypothetical protein
MRESVQYSSSPFVKIALKIAKKILELTIHAILRERIM